MPPSSEMNSEMKLFGVLIGQCLPALFIINRRGTARLIQIPLAISLLLGDLSLTGFLSMLFNMMQLHIVMFICFREERWSHLVKSVLSFI